MAGVDIVMITGGLDLMSPRIAVAPGRALISENYEMLERGAHRMDGYERFDGQSKPSDASYYYATFTVGDTTISAGDTLTGGTSGETAVVISATITSGTVVGGNAAGYLFLRDVSGTFVTGEDLLVAASQVADLGEIPVLNGAPTDAIHAAAIAAETARRRALIAAPTGSGRVRGVWTYGGNAYAFRNNAGGTAVDMWKQSTSGWTQVGNTTEIISFTTGTAAFTEGETLTRSGVTSTIRRVVLQSGTWAGGTAAGYLAISGRSGGNYAAGVGTSAGGSATLSGAQTAVTLPPDGRYRFVNHTFGGAAKSNKMYLVNGEGYAHEFDGTYLIPIKTGALSAALDKPTHVAVFAEHLFLAYRAGSWLFSAIGDPVSFLVSGGAGEIGFGDRITCVLQDAQTALVTGARNKVGYLTGSSADDFLMRIISGSAGMKEHSEAQAIKPTYVDDRGVRDLTATADFGDWKAGTLSEAITPLFDSKRVGGVEPSAAISVKAKDQYRLFFDDMSGVTVYLGRKQAECMLFELPITVRCACRGEDSAGNEILLVGSGDGMVYQLDRGTSWDGTAIEASIQLHFNDTKQPHMDKRFHVTEIGVDADSPVELALSAEFDDASGERPEKGNVAYAIDGGGAFWGTRSWGTFYWDTPRSGRLHGRLDGAGQSCSPAIRSNSATEMTHTLTHMMVNWTPRRQRRIGT